MKTISNKIKQNKVQFLTSEQALWRKELLEKATTIKMFE